MGVSPSRFDYLIEILEVWRQKVIWLSAKVSSILCTRSISFNLLPSSEVVTRLEAPWSRLLVVKIKLKWHFLFWCLKRHFVCHACAIACDCVRVSVCMRGPMFSLSLSSDYLTGVMILSWKVVDFIREKWNGDWFHCLTHQRATPNLVDYLAWISTVFVCVTHTHTLEGLVRIPCIESAGLLLYSVSRMRAKIKQESIRWIFFTLHYRCG